MKKGRLITGLLLIFALCFGIITPPMALATEPSGVEAVEESEDILSPDDAGFWEEFREEYAEDGDYIKRYQSLQEQDGSGISVSDISKDNHFTGELYYTHGSNYDCNWSCGIDVSYWNGNINWEKVKEAGVEYVIIRCGRTLGKETFDDTSIGVDTSFASYITGASSVGLPIGIYYFTQAVTQEEAKKEAEFTIKTLEPYRDLISLPVFLDVETVGSSSRISKVSKTQGTKNAKLFMDAMLEAGYQTGLYGNAQHLTKLCDYTKLTDYPLWLARYAKAPQFSGDFDYWQYTATGTVSGMSGGVDCNFRYLPADSIPEQVEHVAKSGSDDSSVSLKWSAVPGASRYRLYRSSMKNGTYQTVGTISASSTSYQIKQLKTNYAYYFKVKALNDFGNGSASQAAKAQTAKGSQRLLYTTAQATLYANVGEEYEPLATIPKNTLLSVKYERCGTDEQSWYEVDYKDKKGNSYTGFLSQNPVKVGYRAKTKKKVSLRSSASASSKSQKTIKSGQQLVLLSSKKDKDGKTWCQVYYQSGSSSYVGYLLKSTVKQY